MNGVGNVGNKKFCLWPLRFRDLRRSALPGGHQANGKRPRGPQPVTLQSLQCSTLVGGNVGIAYIAYMVRAWGFCHAPGRPDVSNVGNVSNVFGEVESLAKRWGRAAKASHIIQPYSYLTPLKNFFEC
jgi:hypothetical protein